MRVKLAGSRANRDGIGSWVKLRMGGKTLWRHVMPTHGYLSQSELPVTFGLGANDRVDEVSITWPGGEVQKVAGPRVDAVNVIAQSEKVPGKGD
jgi:hypothetical protein